MAQTKKRVIAVSGCKGGVGKTVIAVNLALALAKLGQRVVLMDGNLSVPDVESSMGLDGDVNKMPLEPTGLSSEGEEKSAYQKLEFLDGPFGVKIFTPKAKEGWKDSIQIFQAVELIQRMDELVSDLDTLIIDTAPGLAPDNLTFIQAATEVIVIINREYVSVVDAVKQISLLHRIYNIHKFYIIVNLVSSRKGGAKQFEKLQEQLKGFKKIIVSYLGAIPHDKILSELVLTQTALLAVNDDCRAARTFHRIGYQLTKLPEPELKGRIEFFLPGRIEERIKL